MKIVRPNILSAAVVDSFKDLRESFGLIFEVVERTNIRILSSLNKMAHLKPRGNFFKAVKGNFRLFEALEKVKMEFRLIEGTILVKIF